MRGIWVVLALLALPGVARAGEPQTRYSLAGGCFTLADGSSGQPLPNAERIRMKATALGRYLLFREDSTFLAAQADGSMAPANEPSPAADWNVEEAGTGAFTLAPQSAPDGARTTVRFTPAQGCAEFPEAPLSATGDPRTPSALEYTGVGGLVEGHMHWMTYEYIGGKFHCGRPWHPYGIQYALPDCAENEGPQGVAAPLQNFLNYGNPAQPHDTTGYPKLTSWSASNLTYEGTYWRWIERAWLGGLRLMVMGINENRALCELQANRVTNCNEMDTMRRGFKAVKELEDYADAQAGGPGKGFFQIVTDPYEARRVINSGRMAVVLEIETSEPFDCRGWDNASCDQEQVDTQLKEMYDLGVRSMLLLNKFDNPLVGVRFDGGPAGVIINVGNRGSAGSFWSARTCTGPMTDNTIFQPDATSGALLDTTLTALGATPGTTPTYPPAPHCNTRGLTRLGRHVVNRMMDLGMIVNPDHMSQAGVDDTLTLLESRRYSGVISPHGWMDAGNWPRLWRLGGLAFPGHSDADDYVKEWQEFRPRSTPYRFGWGYGADLGGLSQQPKAVDVNGSITYPFKSYDGKVTFDRQTTGERTFDYTKEGVAHYGLYADWFEDLRRIGGEQMSKDMWDGAEAYLEMWERATGIAASRCVERDDLFTPRGRGHRRLGASWTSLLRSAGQPQERGRLWTWCVAGKRNVGAAEATWMSPSGDVQLVGTTARRKRAGRVRVGARAKRVAKLRTAGRGVRFKRFRGGGAWVYAVRGGRVAAVGVASSSLVRNRAELRRAALALRGATAKQTRDPFVPNEKQEGGGMTGRAFASTGNRSFDETLALLCSLQLQAQAR